MNLRILTLLALIASGCPDRSSPPAKPGAAAAPVAPMARTPVGHAVAQTCRPIGTGEKAEVELSGKYRLTGSVSATATLWLYLSTEPCDPARPVTAIGGAMRVTLPSAFAGEVFAPQGTLGYVCIAAIDGDSLVGLGAAPNNPFCLAGNGEVELLGLDLEVVPTPSPLPKPKGL